MTDATEEVYLIIKQADRAKRRGSKNIRIPPEAVLKMIVAAATCCKPNEPECSNCGREAPCLT